MGRQRPFRYRGVRVELPPYLQDCRVTLRRHPAALWAAEILRLHRSCA